MALTAKWQSINKHINKLNEWGDNRRRRKMDTELIDASVDYLTQMLDMMGYVKEGTQAVPR